MKLWGQGYESQLEAKFRTQNRSLGPIPDTFDYETVSTDTPGECGWFHDLPRCSSSQATL